MANRFTVESVFKAVDRITAPIRRMQSAVGRFTLAAERRLKRLSEATRRWGATLRDTGATVVKLSTVALGSLTAGVGLLVREFSKVEDAQAAFTPLLGGVEKAEQLVGRLNETAASTPFQFETLASVANQLLPVMNGNLDETIKTLRMLGDTAGGNAQKLDSITRGFTKAMLKGKVDLESLNMIGEAGVPIFQELAAVMGTEVNEAFFKVISAGEVATDDLTRAFERMTQKGGVFFRGMEIASETTSGLFSTLKDNVALTAAEVGSVLAPTIKDLIREATTIAQRVREWVKANRELVNQRFLQGVEVLKQVFKGVVDFVLFLHRNGDAVLQWGKWIGIAVIGLKALAVTLGVINVLMLANPITLLVAGIAALSGAVVALIANVDKVDEWLDGLPTLAKAALAPFRALVKAIRFVKENAGVIASAASGAFDATAGFLGFGADEPPATASTAPAVSAPLVTPEAQTARMIERSESLQRTEVTLKDETGRARVTQGRRSNGFTLQQTGAFDA